MPSSSYIDSIILFGDSITQACGPGSLYQRMAAMYERKLDVINRGFSGYNTTWAVPLFKHFFPQTQPVRLVIIWFGANDATIPGHFQHVPLDRFATNLQTLIDIIRSSDTSPKTEVILVGAPPVVPEVWTEWLRQKRMEEGEPHVEDGLDRNQGDAEKYGEAMKKVAQTNGVPYIDTYTALVNAAGGSDPEKLSAVLSDGLHLTSRGYQVVVDAIMEEIKSSLPTLDPAALSMPAPGFDAIPEEWKA